MRDHISNIFTPELVEEEPKPKDMRRSHPGSYPGRGGARNTKKTPKYTREAKASALTVLEFLGNATVASRMMNISTMTLWTWRKELADDPELNEVRNLLKESQATTFDILRKFLETMCAIALMNAHKGKFSDHIRAIDHIADKLNTMLSLQLEQQKIQIASMGIGRKSPELPSLAETHASKKAHYEGLVESILEQAKEHGDEITRDQVVQSMVKNDPDAADYLN